MGNPKQNRRPRRDRGRDHSIEIDLTLDAVECIEKTVADILNRVIYIQKKISIIERRKIC